MSRLWRTDDKNVADALNTDVDTVVKWLILILIIVFDPLAVALVLATNVAIQKYKKDKNSDKSPVTRIERQVVTVPVSSIENNLKKDNTTEKPASSSENVKPPKLKRKLNPEGSSKSF